MEALLEQQRRYHEERERLMEALVAENLHRNNPDKNLTHREKLQSDHRAKVIHIH